MLGKVKSFLGGSSLCVSQSHASACFARVERSHRSLAIDVDLPCKTGPPRKGVAPKHEPECLRAYGYSMHT